jgi:hypothetical protein
MTTTQIKISSILDGGREYDATFEPVRSIKGYTVGWALITFDDGSSVRFPAVRTPFVNSARRGGGETVLTVSVWDGDWGDWVDLTSADGINEIDRTGSGKLCNPATGRDSDLWHVFK